MSWFSDIFKKAKRNVWNPFVKGAKRASNIFKKGYKKADKFAHRAADFVDDNVFKPAERVMDRVEKIPIIGTVADAVTGPIRGAIDTARDLGRDVGAIQKGLEGGLSKTYNKAKKDPYGAAIKIAGLGKMDPHDRLNHIRAELGRMAGRPYTSAKANVQALKQHKADLVHNFRTRHL